MITFIILVPVVGDSIIDRFRGRKVDHLNLISQLGMAFYNLIFIIRARTTKKKKDKGLPLNEFTVININAAGIDISSKDNVVSIPQGRDKENIRTFGAFTCDLIEIACWLIKCNITSVAMVTKKEEFNMSLYEQHQAAFKEKRIKSLEKQIIDLKQVA